jgi:hypothetical protein
VKANLGSVPGGLSETGFGGQDNELGSKPRNSQVPQTEITLVGFGQEKGRILSGHDLGN